MLDLYPSDTCETIWADPAQYHTNKPEICLTPDPEGRNECNVEVQEDRRLAALLILDAIYSARFQVEVKVETALLVRSPTLINIVIFWDRS